MEENVYAKNILYIYIYHWGSDYDKRALFLVINEKCESGNPFQIYLDLHVLISYLQ